MCVRPDQTKVESVSIFKCCAVNPVSPDKDKDKNPNQSEGWRYALYSYVDAKTGLGRLRKTLGALDRR